MTGVASVRYVMSRKIQSSAVSVGLGQTGVFGMTSGSGRGEQYKNVVLESPKDFKLSLFVLGTRISVLSIQLEPEDGCKSLDISPFLSIPKLEGSLDALLETSVPTRSDMFKPLHLQQLELPVLIVEGTRSAHHCKELGCYREHNTNFLTRRAGADKRSRVIVN